MSGEREFQKKKEEQKIKTVFSVVGRCVHDFEFGPSSRPRRQFFVCLFVVCLFVIYLFEHVEVLAAIKLMWTCYTHQYTKDSHNTGNFMPYSSRIVCGFFNVPH